MLTSNLLINYATLLAYLAFAVDLLLQVMRIYRRQSSRDISWIGVCFRLFASAILVIKLTAVGDAVLIAGQIVFTLTIAIYLFMVVKYHHPVKKRR